MFKNIIKKILLFIKNKKRGVVSDTHFISLKTDIDTNTIIGRESEIDAHCIIGKNCYIGKNCFLTKVSIGNYCSIANNVSIGQGEHDLYQISTSSFFYDDAYELLTQDHCTIGHDVWIGVDSIILRGVTIGNGAVIGANSVVAKDVPSFAIVAGSPAKVIRYRFDSEKIKKIEASKWWHSDIVEAKEKIDELERVN